MTDDILSAARQHLLTLAPHVKGRQTAQLLTQVCDELERIRTQGDASLLLAGIIRQTVQVELLPGGNTAEVCCGGFRYMVWLRDGVPILDDVARRAVLRTLGD